MRRAATILVAGLAVVSAAAEPRAADGTEHARPSASAVPADSLLYLDQLRWRQADGTQKMALATDFMRIFCGNPAMPPSDLVGCLDGVADSGSMFERALSCVGTSNASRF